VLNFLLLALLADPPAPQWMEVAVPQSSLRVVTDSGEKAGRRVALQIVQFDRVLQKRFSWIKGANETPLVVFASADESMVRSMAPDTTDAEKDNAFSSYLAGQTQHTGAMRTDLPETADKDRSPTRGFYRGRAAFLVERSLGRSAPSWLVRGLVTFLSDAVVKDKEAQVGRMTAADGDGPGLTALPAAEFFREGRPADRRSDLQAGLFVHYLLVGENGKNAPSLDALLLSLAGSDPQTSSVAAKVAALYAGFPKYLAQKKFAALKLPIDVSVVATAFTVRPLPLVEALMLRAEVLFDLNRPVDARGLLRQVKTLDPKLPRPLEIEAVLYEREQRSAESRKAIETAIQLGSKNASLYYRLAQLQWARNMTRPVLLSVQKLLETARDLSPGDPSTLSYLAEVQGDLSLAAPALDHAQKGAQAAPNDVYSLMALARAQWNAKQTDPALASAKKALALARLATQKQRVQEFQAFAVKNKAAQAKGTKPWPTQFGPPPPGVFGASRLATSSDRVNVGGARTDSADASAITECFANRNDAACGRAVPALEGACLDKQAASCVSLGSLYDGGFGIARDRKKAAGYYKTACDLADKAGCARLAVLEAQGLVVASNATRARQTLESLCAEKVPEACIGLAQILQRTGFAIDRDRARTLLKTACDGGSAEACGLMTAR
jgi:TPR repeat protein